MSHEIALKRVYDPAAPDDGNRYLVDRLWPRGAKKDSLHLSGWLREVAPSPGLRQWFGHDPKKWATFRKRYLAELEAKPKGLDSLHTAAQQGKITLLFAAKDLEHNNAVVLRDFLAREQGA